MKCGKCLTCLRPSMHKPCLNPVPKPGSSEDAVDTWSRCAQHSTTVKCLHGNLAVKEAKICLILCIASPLMLLPLRPHLGYHQSYFEEASE